nr:MAG: branched-chain amino acid ABC transporter permease [Actinomycetota bacterium]
MATETINFEERRVKADVPTVVVDVFINAMKVVLLFFVAWSVVGAIALQVRGELISGAQWRDVLTGGIVLGAMFGLVALGYSMVYGILGFINFAHGEVFMTGMFGAMFMAHWTARNGLLENATPLAMLLIVLAAMIVSATVAVTVEKIAYRPLRGAPRLIPLITSIGVSFFLQYAVSGLFGTAVRRFPELPESMQQRFSFLGLLINASQLTVFIVTAVAVVALWWFVTRSKTGRAIRAVAEDKEIAALMGIDVDRTIVMTFMVGGVMAGVSGAMWAFLYKNVFFLSGFLPGIKAFTAAVLGGIGNLPGALLGGMTLGLVEAAGPTMLTAYRWAIPDVLAYVVGVASLAIAAWGFMRLRNRIIAQTSTNVSMVVLGLLFGVMSFTVLPGFHVTIPGTSQLKDAIAFIVLVGVLMIRPVGLLGERLAVEERG